MKMLLKDIFGAIVAPGRSLKSATEAPGRIRRAAAAVGVVGFLYALTSLALGASGAVPMAPVLRGLDADNYYFLQMVLILPAFFVIWVLSAVLLRCFVTRRAGGGSFGKALSAAGPALSGPLLVAWLPPAVQAGFMVLGMGQEEWVAILSDPGPWQSLYIACYALAALSAVRLFVAASAALRKRRGIAALLHGMLVAALAVAAFIAWVR